jgi:hypothetical protein
MQNASFAALARRLHRIGLLPFCDYSVSALKSHEDQLWSVLDGLFAFLARLACSPFQIAP